MDYDDIIVHIFQKSIREFYEIERIWGDAPRIEIDEKNPSGVSLEKREVV